MNLEAERSDIFAGFFHLQMHTGYLRGGEGYLKHARVSV